MNLAWGGDRAVSVGSIGPLIYPIYITQSPKCNEFVQRGDCWKSQWSLKALIT
jgi:hypothetical protein